MNLLNAFIFSFCKGGPYLPQYSVFMLELGVLSIEVKLPNRLRYWNSACSHCCVKTIAVSRLMQIYLVLPICSSSHLPSNIFNEKADTQLRLGLLTDAEHLP